MQLPPGIDGTVEPPAGYEYEEVDLSDLEDDDTLDADEDGVTENRSNC